MSIVIESNVSQPTLSVQEVERPVSQQVVVQEPPSSSYSVVMVPSRPVYNIGLGDSLGGFVMILAATLVCIKLLGGNDTFGSFLKGAIGIIGGCVLFVYSFGMAIL